MKFSRQVIINENENSNKKSKLKGDSNMYDKSEWDR